MNSNVDKGEKLKNFRILKNVFVKRKRQ